MSKKTLYKLLLNLSGDRLSPIYRKTLHEWLENDRTDHDEDLRSLWDMHSLVSQDQIFKALQSSINSRRDYERKESRTNWTTILLKTCAAILLFVVGGIASWIYTEGRYADTVQMITCVAQDGETKTIKLSDGTEIVLFGGSRVIYPKQFSARTDRNVFLSGKAHFNVKRNPSHPFNVNVDDISIKVLGTTFGLRAYTDEGDIIATLEKGRIVMSKEGVDSIILHPNEQAIYNKHNQHITLKHVDAGYNSSECMNFTNKTLQYILGELKHHFGTQFQVEKGIDINKRYYLDFTSDESLSTILSVLVNASDEFTITQQGNKVKLTKNRKEA